MPLSSDWDDWVLWIDEVIGRKGQSIDVAVVERLRRLVPKSKPTLPFPSLKVHVSELASKYGEALRA